MTPAHYAAKMGNMDSMNLLIEKGALLSAVDSDGVNVLGELVRNDNIEMLEMFVKEAI